jgi:DNA helicase-2/ATP-dependent DNA helicase PcrA
MSLNKEQLQAVNSNSDRILCLAGAGAGKTKSFIERISRLVQDGVAPSSILALTFTNAAAAEMRSRYEDKNIGKEIPEFRTFHSFCYSVLCKDPAVRSALGYEGVPGIATDEQEKVIEDKAKLQCKITISDEKLKSRVGLTKKEQFQADLYDKAVKRLMRSENLITFDRLNSEVAELFASNDSSTNYYKDVYCYIFVDEFQDTDKFQIKFLNSFTKTNFYFCGDTLQEIYHFRGTSNEYIKALANTPDWEKIKLFTNYRSTNQICAYANEFSAGYADASYRIEMQGIRDGEKVITKRVEKPSRYAVISTEDIDDVLNEISSLQGTSAILCRTNKEVNAIAAYLKENGIEFTSGKDNKFQKLIECALADTYLVGYLAAQLPSAKYGEYIRLSAKEQNPDLAWFIGLYGKVSQVSDVYSTVMKLREIAVSQKFTNVKLNQAAELLNLKNLKETEQYYEGKDFLNYLKDAVSAGGNSELYVGTIHSVKGLEYDNVFVMNVGSFNFKLDSEEMKNLFYVAITRAKNRLFVYKLFAY